ncbi:MAG TPA: hypothetical protein VNI84_07215 [Pyrinomonadaceae bacterium]|nr:hypothetical protein [Pyrinomonadaceae bacterium]
MKFHIFIFLAIIVFSANFSSVSAQADSVIGQITSSAQESFAGGISGDGRLVVFESTGNVATENPRNADGNREIFVFDYAQRRIFQITDTRSLLTDITKPVDNINIKVAIVNLRPVISNDGRWIAFSSNANSLAQPIANLTPGSFDANTLTDSAGNNALTQDANTELWLYQIPAVTPVNLSSGSEIQLTDLSAGTFVRVTNTTPSRLPTAGSATAGPVVADDNREASINDNGNYVAFVSNRDLVPNAPGGNASPNNNDEIFTYVRNTNTIAQVTRTTRGTISAPTYNQNPTVSGNGLRVAFLSNAENPVIGMSGGSNADGNVEIFYTDLNASGNPVATAPSATVIGRQVTTTTRTNPGDIVNVLDFGRRMSRDGRYIAFDSYADLAGGGANQISFALYLFDTTLTTAPFRQIGPRSDADSAATGGDISHFPGFTDYNSSGAPQTLVFESRLNFRPDGTIPTTEADGLNPNAARPVQIYSYPINAAPATATFTRLTRFPTPSGFLGLTQPITSNSLNRMAFNLAFTEVGTGNTDLQTEAFYFLLPVATTTSAAAFNFTTGASRLSVSATPSPTTTPTPTPTPSVTPTPQTPSAVLGVSPGMLTFVNFVSGTTPTITAQTAVGLLQRSFTLPIELSGVTVTINGAAAGIKSVSQDEVLFVVPPGLPTVAAGTAYPIIINNNGTVFRGTITVVPGRPDIFTNLPTPGPGGRARVFNATNRVLTGEPITITTVRIRGGRRVPTVFRVFLTGVGGVPNTAITIRVGTRDISGTAVSAPVLREPGVYSIDFTLPTELRGAGDVPIIITVNAGGTIFQSRLEDTAPRFRIL